MLYDLLIRKVLEGGNVRVIALEGTWRQKMLDMIANELFDESYDKLIMQAMDKARKVYQEFIKRKEAGQLAYESNNLEESIQELIKDMKATQHGDFTNPFYDITKDFHKEGGVYKHTLIGLQAMDEIVSKLRDELPEDLQRILDSISIHKLRAGYLYHDIAKITTIEPAKKRIGSYSFPGHGSKEAAEGLFDKYGIEVGEDVKNLAYHHHDSPDQFKEFADKYGDKEALALAVIKIADNMSVGPRSFEEAYEHVKVFLDKLEGPDE